MKIGIIIQARMGSKRLPKKVLKKIGNKTILEILVNRLSKIKMSNIKIIIATSDSKEDDPIFNLCKNRNFEVFRGSLLNVADRYIKCAEYYQIDTIIRITGDCPLIDPELVRKSFSEFLSKKIDYLSTTCPPFERTYPDGMDIEIFNTKTLKDFFNKKHSNEYEEHVTFQYWKKSNYKTHLMRSEEDLSKFRLTLDHKEDYEVIRLIIKALGVYASLKDIISYLKINDDVFKLNSMYYFGQGWEQ